jgi:hypothetical protein
MIEKIEKKVFFRFTRLFAWVIIIPAFLALIYSGYHLLQTAAAGASSITITYDDIKKATEGNTADGMSGLSGSMRAEDHLNKYTKQINMLLDILGPQVDRFRAEELLKSQILREEEKDRRQFIEGLIEVVKKAPEALRLQVIDTYMALWNAKKIERANTAAEKNQKRMLYIGTLVGAFSTIAFLSLMLVLLSIERNTRQEHMMPTREVG